MKSRHMRRGPLAAVAGGACWAFGATSAVLGELEYLGQTNNTIPEAVGWAVSTIGTVLLLVSFVSMRRRHVASGAGEGTPAYWIAVAGFGLTLVPVWPFFVMGPMVIGIGVTIYAAIALSEGKVRSLGLWLHALCIPVGVVTGFAFYWGGYDGGIGIPAFILLLIMGFMSLAYDAAEASVSSLVSDRHEVVA